MARNSASAPIPDPQPSGEHVRRPADEAHIRISTPIARWVSLCLDNTTTDPVSRGLVRNGFPDEIPVQLSCVTWQAGL